MNTLIDHLQAYQGLYIMLLVAAAMIGILFASDTWSVRRTRGDLGQGKRPDHERTVHTHHPFAGMDESGP